ncbi:hypothetical protein GX50_03878 [[Emmonsia] crescens]|uniref:Uncharacterized protein n=1 Tax=[Emmonsia] crescens TaxID=73230 RepID=A0A2B7ZI70_9EURO|nr:hypothetical protein GX50_03878 [Emmonsia crescens]
MKNMEMGVECLKMIRKLLENAQDQLYNRICDEHAIKLQPAHQKLAQNQVLAAISNQECSMNKIQAVLNNLHSASDVDVTVKAKIYECMLRHQTYQSKCDYHDSCSEEWQL